MAPKANHDEVLRLIQEHQKIIYKICNSYCNNKNDREDLGQEIVYQLIKSYPSFNPQFKFSTLDVSRCSKCGDFILPES